MQQVAPSHRWLPRRLERLRLPAQIAALALLAVAGNHFNIELMLGVDILFGPIAVLLAIVWLGTVPGLIVAAAAAGYTWLLWGHPYALPAFLAEAAFIGAHRDWMSRRGRAPPPLPVSAALYWFLLGMPLGLLCYGLGLGAGWPAALLLAAKQGLNGILNAALAELILIAITLLTHRRAALPVAQVLFGVLLAGVLLPSLLVAVWGNWDIRERLEPGQAERMRIFGQLALHDLPRHVGPDGADPAALQAELDRLASALPATFAARAVLVPGQVQAPTSARRPLAQLGRWPEAGAVVATSVPDLVLRLPQQRHASRVATLRAAHYRLELPARLPGFEGRLVVEASAAPLVERVRSAVTWAVLGLLGLALLGVLLARWMSRRLAAPLLRLVETTRALPDAIREGRPWPRPLPGRLAETRAVADAVTEMAQSLAAGFGALREEKDEQARQRVLLDLQAQMLSVLVAGSDDESRYAGRLCALVQSLLPGHHAALIQPRPDGTLQVLAAPGLTADERAGLEGLLARRHGLGGIHAALATGTAAHVADLGADLPGAGRAGLRSALSLPLLGRGGMPLGVLNLASPSPGRPEPFARDLLQTAATLAALGVESIRLRRRHEVLLEALSAAGTGIAVARAGDDGCQLSYANSGFCQLTGFSAEEVLGRDIRTLECLCGRPADQARVREAVAAGAPLRLVAGSRRRDGSEFSAALSLTPMRNAEGRVTNYVVVQQDLSETVAVMERLRHSEASLNEAQGIAHLGNWELDLADGAMVWSDECFRLLGYAPGAVRPNLALVWTLLPEAERERLRDELDAVRADPRRGLHLEPRVLGADGVERVLLLRARVITDAAGAAVRLIGTSLDVTAQRRLEQSLRAQEERYRLVVEHVDDLIVRVDADGRLGFVSPSYCRTFGRDDADLLGRPFDPEVHPDDRAATAEALLSLAVPPHACRFEHRAETALGWRWIQWACQALLDAGGAVTGLVAVGRDISERKAAALAIADSEQRFRTLFETMAEGIVYHDADGRIIDANPAAARVLGLSPEQLLGRDALDPRWRAVREDGSDFPGHEHPAMLALRTGEEPADSVMGVVRPDGELRWLLVHARPERRPGAAHPHQVFATFADITLLKRAEQRLATIIESSPHGIIEVEPGTRRLLWANRAMLDMFGYTLEQWRTLRANDLHPPEALARVDADFARMARGGLMPTINMPCRRRDGSRFYAVISPGIMRLGPEQTVTAFFTDVTAEYEARRALERAREALLSAQGIARLGSWEYDLIADELTWSPEVFRIFEQNPARFEPSYEAFFAAVHPDDRGLVESAFNAALKGHGAYLQEHRLLLPDGRIKWVQERAEIDLAADGTPIATRGTVQDVTERRTAELALADRERRLTAIIDGTRVGTWEWEIATGATRYNERWAGMLGYRLAELGATSIRTWEDLTHPEDLARSIDALDAHFRGEDDAYECEIRMRHRDGHWVWVLDTGRVTERSGDGAPLAMAGFHQDITPRKLAELALGEREAMLRELLAVAARFVTAADDDIDALIARSSTAIGGFRGVDWSWVGHLDDAGRLTRRAEWIAEDIDPAGFAAVEQWPLPALAEQLRAGTPAILDDLGALPESWSAEARHLGGLGLRALLVVPVTLPGAVPGCVGFGDLRGPRTWSDAEVRFLQVYANILSAALERARATAELRASNARYDQLARQSRIMAWEVDADGHYTYLSPVCEELLGYRPEELVGTNCFDLLAADERPALEQKARETFASGAPFRDFINPCVTRDGRRVWMLTNGAPVLDADGTLLGYRGTDTDVSERQWAQQRLADSEARLATVVDNAPIGIALVGPERQIVMANRALASFLARPADGLARLPLAEVTHPEDLDKDLRRFIELLAGRRSDYRVTKRFLRPDGEVVWGDVRVTLLPRQPGEAPVPLAMVEDITELHIATERQRALEEALASYASHLEELVDLINLSLPPLEHVQAMLRLGCKGLGMDVAVLAEVADGAQRVLCATSDNVPRLPAALLRKALALPGVPAMLTGPRLPRAAVAAGFGGCIGVAFAAASPDGPDRTLVLALWGPAHGPEPTGPQREMLRLIAQRIAAVRYREQAERELMDAKARETIGHLASGVAHDFNNLLGVIDANIFYLDASLGDLGAADEEVRQVLDETRSAIGQAKVITSGMLSLSRTGGVPLEPVDLLATVAELVRILRQVLPPTIDLTLEIPAGLSAHSNAAFLQSALLNLALNARDAMPAGGALTIRAAPADGDAGPLAVGVPPAGERVELVVADTGCGIAPEILGRIFDPLFSTKAKRRGHGLGLFMVQEFVNRSGAGLAVESEPGAGTRFRLLLPCSGEVVGLPTARLREPALGPAAAPARAEQATAGTRRVAPAAAPSGPRVLVVDDDPRVRDAVIRLLALDGMQAITADHGQTCLDLLGADADVDLILSDIAMPVMDGIQLQQRLAHERPDLPVILMTGQEHLADLAGAAAEPPVVLRKPLDPEVLRAAIAARIGERSPAAG